MAYLTGKDGAVTLLADTAVRITKFEYKEKGEMTRSRAAGDPAFSRKRLATDWELNVTIVIEEGQDADTLLDLAALRNSRVPFLCLSDPDPAVYEIEGVGACTEWTFGVPEGEDVTLDLKIECDDPSADGLPTITRKPSGP